MTTSRTGAVRRVGVLVCVLVLAVAGCSSGSNKEKNVQTMSEPDVTSQVQRYADDVVTLIGNTRLQEPAASAAGCEGKLGEVSRDIFYVQGAYLMPVPAEQHLTTLARVREQWRQRGYTITDDRTFPDGKRGVLAATIPTDGYRIKLESGVPAIAFSLLVHSSCYRSPTPRA
jgi:hypothetical protein